MEVIKMSCNVRKHIRRVSGKNIIIKHHSRKTKAHKNRSYRSTPIKPSFKRGDQVVAKRTGIEGKVVFANEDRGDGQPLVVDYKYKNQRHVWPTSSKYWAKK
jgi:hypothetical protein